MVCSLLMLFISGTTVARQFSDAPVAPLLNLPSGFYPGGTSLAITHPDPGASIYYTLDGSMPHPSSATTFSYHNPLILSAPAASDKDISLIRTNPAEADAKGFGWKAPVSYPKAMVVRAMACMGADCSAAASASYFVDRPVPGLPLISLIIDPYALFDHHNGIYIPGIVYETNGYGDGYYGQNNANYYRLGDEWEVATWMEFFENGQLVIRQNVGVRIHGGGTRALPQKSLRVYARGEYGKSTLNHRIFPWQDHTHYKRLILRNSGQDFFSMGTLMRDGLLQKIAEPLRLSIQDYRPSILYLNGEYWGIQNIRERYDQHYFARKYGIPEDQLDFMENNARLVLGSTDHYLAMLEFISRNDLSDPQAFAQLKTMMDTDNYIDYFITNVYCHNIDWPGHNLKYWRKRTNYNPHAAWGHDGRWRWTLNDLDFCFGIADGGQAYKINTLAYATSPVGGEWPPNPEWSTFLIRQLLKNNDFRNAFISRFADVLNTVFSTTHLLANIHAAAQLLQPEIPQHIDRWKYPAEDINQWITNVNRLKTFATHRPSWQTQHILDHFGLSGTFRLTADVQDPATGSIKVNQLHITDGNPLLAHTGSSLPWSGTYFSGVSFPVAAMPAKGYVFQKWLTNTGQELFDNPVWVNSHSDLGLTAVFVPSEEPPLALLHYWHFNNLPAGTLGSIHADYSFTASASLSYPGSGAGYLDRVDDGSSLNADQDILPGYALRVRNPSDTRQLELLLPTNGHKNIRLSYAAKRTINGAEQQAIFYRTTTGHWMQFGEFISITEDYQLVDVDFSALEEANNNPGFAVRVVFQGRQAPETSGNNRLDNISLHGLPAETPNMPPFLVQEIPLLKIIEQDQPHLIDLSKVFMDEEGDPLTFTATSSRPQEAAVVVNGQQLAVSALRRGDAEITLTASDGYNLPAAISFRVLVYPSAFTFSQPVFAFSNWDADKPERTFPQHMLFLQSQTNDPDLEHPLLFPYFIPHTDYHADDQATIGFPYNNTGRSRINGLGSEGISFINTGRGRDLGGALLAINTQDLTECFVSFTASTLLPNSRTYNLRLQYRTAWNNDFTDVTDPNGNPVEYQRADLAGHTAIFLDIPLPPQALGQPYVQLLWRYYFTGQQLDPNSGQRTMIRLDDIRVGQATTGSPLAENSNFYLQLYPNPVSHTLGVDFHNNRAGTLSWMIVGIRGDVVLRGTAHHEGFWQTNLNVDELPPGIYTLRIITQQAAVSRKFVRIL